MFLAALWIRKIQLSVEQKNDAVKLQKLLRISFLQKEDIVTDKEKLSTTGIQC